MTGRQIRTIMAQAEIRETLSRFASEIQEQYPDLENLAILGIHTGGAHLAKRLVNILEERTGTKIQLGLLDITMYRDDLAMEKDQPVVRKTEIPIPVSRKIIILMDDVLYTGRTVRAALDAIIDFGRPKAIRLAVIVDRGLREFPIRPDYVGKSISTEQHQRVRVHLREENYPEDTVTLEMGD